jgi:DNA-binding transcriptional LysR family regulator
MRLTLRQLQIFLAVAQSESTTTAAGTIALSQSAISASLIELEGLLNAKLFDRIGKRLILNDNGRALVPQARQMMDAAANIEQHFSDSTTVNGIELHIGASTTIGIYILPAILRSSRTNNIDFCPRVMIANTADVAHAVANFDVDLGLIEGPCHEPDLEVEPWMRDELIIVSAPHDPIYKEKGKVSVKKLRESGWLLREPGSGTREAVEQALLPHLHHLRPAGEFSNSEAIKHAASEGLGIACLSRCVVNDFIETGRLVEIRTTLPILRRDFYLIYSKHKIFSNRLKYFLNHSRAWAK